MLLQKKMTANIFAVTNWHLLNLECSIQYQKTERTRRNSPFTSETSVQPSLVQNENTNKSTQDSIENQTLKQTQKLKEKTLLM